MIIRFDIFLTGYAFDPETLAMFGKFFYRDENFGLKNSDAFTLLHPAHPVFEKNGKILQTSFLFQPKNQSFYEAS